MTKFDEGLIKDYKAIIAHIEFTVSGLYGIITKDTIDQRDRLETQLVNRNLTHAMTQEDLENYYYNLTRV